MHEFPVVLTNVYGPYTARPSGPGAGRLLISMLVNDVPVRSGFRLTSGAARAVDGEERRIDVDQTNESWVIADRVIVKWHTEPLTGPEPGPDRLRRLFGAGFKDSPKLWGILEWHTPAGHWVPVATAVEYVPDATDGWTWCVQEARIALGLAEGTPRSFARELGAVTGRMHLALADSAGLVAVHGDYHVGQILRTTDGALLVVDFDGNPTISPAERVEHRPAAFDVAGMLMSLENVGYVAVKHHPDFPDERVKAWSDERQEEFLQGYRELAGHLLSEELLDKYLDHQIQRELDYAAKHLPRWAYVPEAALRRRGRL